MAAYTYEDAVKAVDAMVEARATYYDTYNRTHLIPIMGKYGGYERVSLLLEKSMAEAEGKPFIITEEFMNHINEQTAMYEQWSEDLKRKWGFVYDKCGN